MAYREGFPEALQMDSQQEETWTLNRQAELLALLWKYSTCHIFVRENIVLDEGKARMVRRFEENVTLLMGMEGSYYRDIAKLRLHMKFIMGIATNAVAQRTFCGLGPREFGPYLVPLAKEPQSGEFFLPFQQMQEIQDMLRENSPIKMLGIIKEHNNGHPYIDILTAFDRSAIMVWINRQNLVLNTTVVQTKLNLPTDGIIVLKDLLQEKEADMKNITVEIEFLSGEKRVLTSPDYIIRETCVISVKMSGTN